MVAPSSDGLFRGMKQIGDILIGLSDRPTRRNVSKLLVPRQKNNGVEVSTKSGRFNQEEYQTLTITLVYRIGMRFGVKLWEDIGKNIFVGRIHPYSIAYNRLQAGDVILCVDGQDVQSIGALEDSVYAGFRLRGKCSLLIHRPENLADVHSVKKKEAFMSTGVRVNANEIQCSRPINKRKLTDACSGTLLIDDRPQNVTVNNKVLVYKVGVEPSQKKRPRKIPCYATGMMIKQQQIQKQFDVYKQISEVSNELYLRHVSPSLLCQLQPLVNKIQQLINDYHESTSHYGGDLRGHI